MPGPPSNVSPFVVELTFHGDLDFFLKNSAVRLIERQLREKTSIKDVIESCGVPHPEVDLILVDSQPVDFAHVVSKSSKIDVYPVSWHRATFLAENRLQVLKTKSFVADVHLGKLVRNLRLLGFDVAYHPTAQDRELIGLAHPENPSGRSSLAKLRQDLSPPEPQTSAAYSRALLTRDRRLLMYAAVNLGYYLRSQDPIEQTLEVLRRFQLSSSLAPFTRCLRCNTLIEAVEKAEIIDQLEPLTKIYYEQFRRCPSCGQIYWPGSHFKKLEARIAHLRQQLIFGLCNSPKSA
jgi:uncharacterized protein with PIN domain